MGRGCLLLHLFPIIVVHLPQRAKLSQREQGLDWDGASLWVASVNVDLRTNPVSFLNSLASSSCISLCPLTFVQEAALPSLMPLFYISADLYNVPPV